MHGVVHREPSLCSSKFGAVKSQALHHPEQSCTRVPATSDPFHENLSVLWSHSCVTVPQSVSHFVPLILEGSALTNGGLNLHSSVKRKLEAEKDYVFDKRLRYSVRQNESNCRFRDIVVRKEEGFTHILLSSQTSDNNALTPEVRGQDGGWVSL